jgi:hypothetical protein
VRALDTPTLAAALAVAVIAVVAAVIILWLLSSPDSGEETEAVGPPAIELVLTAEEAGLVGGDVEPIRPTEGPGAPTYCNHSPDIDGLLGWDGNRVTAPNGQRRLAQMVARFRSSVHAAAYLASNSALIDCQTWESTTEDPVVFTVTEVVPRRILGDETKQFELTATRDDDAALYLRTILVRSGAMVAQLTMVSTDEADLGILAELAELAATRLEL